ALAALAAGMLLVVPALAAAPLHSPAGTWVTNGGESKYEIRLCGDGDDLCAKMVWVNDTPLGQKLKPYLGESLLITAPRVANQKRCGTLTVQSQTMNGRYEPTEANNSHFRGCAGALCEGVELFRVEWLRTRLRPGAAAAPGSARRRGWRKRSAPRRHS